jgi:hypothetical protein
MCTLNTKEIININNKLRDLLNIKYLTAKQALFLLRNACLVIGESMCMYVMEGEFKFN